MTVGDEHWTADGSVGCCTQHAEGIRWLDVATQWMRAHRVPGLTKSSLATP